MLSTFCALQKYRVDANWVSHSVFVFHKLWNTSAHTTNNQPLASLHLWQTSQGIIRSWLYIVAVCQVCQESAASTENSSPIASPSFTTPTPPPCHPAVWCSYFYFIICVPHKPPCHNETVKAALSGYFCSDWDVMRWCSFQQWVCGQVPLFFLHVVHSYRQVSVKCL